MNLKTVNLRHIIIVIQIFVVYGEVVGKQFVFIIPFLKNSLAAHVQTIMLWHNWKEAVNHQNMFGTAKMNYAKTVLIGHANEY